jgi:molybdopterin molybdotransferase
VAIKPGKPGFFGVHPNHTLCFGLPGNPVAALLNLKLYVELTLKKMQGLSPKLTYHTATLSQKINKKAGRKEWVRALAEWNSHTQEYSIRPVVGQDSYMLGGLTHANALIDFPAEGTELEAQQKVNFIPLNWSWI